MIWDRRHLGQVLTEYLRHYNAGRPHCGVNLRVPIRATQPLPASISQLHRIERTDVLGGLIHEYSHAA